jgi:hypothetical protein
MADLTYTSVTPDGVNDATLTAADASGDTFPSDTNKLFKVANGDTSSHTVTIAAPVTETVCGSYGKVDLDDIVISVPAGESRVFVLPTGYTSGGKFNLTYDDVTSVTIGGFALSVNG